MLNRNFKVAIKTVNIYLSVNYLEYCSVKYFLSILNCYKYIELLIRNNC